MNSVDVGKFIAYLRTQRGWTQTQFANVLNVSNKKVSKWENGRGFPDVTMFPIIAKIFDITIEELIQGHKNLIEGKEQEVVLSEMDYNEILKAMSPEQEKMLKNKILRNSMAKVFKTLSKIFLVVALVTMVVIVSLIGNGVIASSFIMKLPKTDDFTCQFFATPAGREIKSEYKLNGEPLYVSFDFSICTNTNIQYKVQTTALENGFYLNNLYYYEIKRSDGVTNYLSQLTNSSRTMYINNNNYMNTTAMFDSAGTYEIKGVCMFKIKEKLYQFTDSITVNILTEGDNFGENEMVYSDIPQCNLNGYITDQYSIFYGDNIAWHATLHGVKFHDFENYIAKFVELGYSHTELMSKENKQHIFINDKYKIYLYYYTHKNQNYVIRNIVEIN